MIFSSSRGVSSTGSLAGFESPLKIAATVEALVSPGKARCPVVISYKTEPKEKMSDPASTFLPSACSGDM